MGGWVEEAFEEQKRQPALNKRCACEVCVGEFWAIRAGDIGVMVQGDRTYRGVAVNITCFQCVFKMFL